MSGENERQAAMVDIAVEIVAAGFGRIGWADRSDGKAPRHAWKNDATDDPALVPRLLHGARNALVIPKGPAIIIDVDRPAVWADLIAAGLPETLIVDTPNPAGGHGHVYGFVPPGTDMSTIPATFAGGEIRREALEGRASMVLGPWAATAAGVYRPRAGSTIAVLPETVLDYLRSSLRRQTAERRTAAGPGDPGWFITTGRHGFLVARGRNLRGIGLTGERLLDELLRLDRDRCRPPIQSLPPPRGIGEIRAIVEWIETQIPDDPPPIRITGTRPAADAGPEPEPTPPWPDPPAEAAYYGVFGDMVSAIAPHTEADPVALLGTFTTLFGAACGHWRAVHQGDWQAANLFTILVGESGAAGRKGTSLAIGREVVRAAYPELDTIWAPGLGSGEGIVGFLRRRKPTGEHRMLLVESEFGRLLRVIGREGSTVSQLLREAYDGVPIGRLLAREDDVISWHHVALIGHITPVEVRASLTVVERANGFVNRGLWLCVRQARVVPVTQPAAPLAKPYREAVHRAIVEAQTRLVLDHTDEAKDWWESYRKTTASSQHRGLTAALTARGATQVARLGLIFALADRSTVIDVRHLEAGRALVEYGERSVRFVFGESTGNRHADVLLRILRAEGEIDWQNVKALTGLALAADREDAIRALVDYGAAEVVNIARKGGGRPRRVIRLRPGPNGTNGTNGTGPAQGGTSP